MPSVLSERANFTHARSAALSLLEKAGVERPPVDPVKIAESVGVRVRFVEFSGPSETLVSGYFDPEDNMIVINKREFAPRQTFTVAHELGHKVLHSEWANSDQYEVFLETQVSG